MSTYLISQATGQQSQAIIAHLLASGAKIHAVVRDLNKVPDTLKSNKNITLFQGESANLGSLLPAAKGCSAAFLNTFPYPGLEIQQAKTILAACEAVGIPHVVASSTFTVNDSSFWDDQDTTNTDLLAYFQSKAEVEAAVKGSKLKSYTILRPAVIHSDFFYPGVYTNFPSLPSGKLDSTSDKGVKVLYTDCQDIGRYGAAALQDPARFGGEEIDLAHENLSADEVRDILARVSGKQGIEVERLEGEERKETQEKVFGQRFHIWANYKDFSVYENKAKEVGVKFGMPFTGLEEAVTRDRVKLMECLEGFQG